MLGNNFISYLFFVSFTNIKRVTYDANIIGQTLIGAEIARTVGTEVSWLSFDGDTYFFGDDCIEAPVEEAPEEEAPAQPTVPERVETAAFGG